MTGVVPFFSFFFFFIRQIRRFFFHLPLRFTVWWWQAFGWHGRDVFQSLFNDASNCYRKLNGCLIEIQIHRGNVDGVDCRSFSSGNCKLWSVFVKFWVGFVFKKKPFLVVSCCPSVSVSISISIWFDWETTFARILHSSVYVAWSPVDLFLFPFDLFLSTPVSWIYMYISVSFVCGVK